MMASLIEQFVAHLRSLIQQETLNVTDATEIAAAKTITLYELVQQQRLALGPLASTGGTIHLITDAQAVVVTKALYNAAVAIESKLYTIGLTLDTFLPLLFAWVRGESGFDPACINPNNNLAKPGESAYDTFMHTDWGLAQVNGSILNGLLPDYPWEQQRDTALDPEWASVRMVATILEDLTWGAQTWHLLTSAWLGKFPPLVTTYTVGAEAYNKGKSGAAARAIKASGAKAGVNGTDENLYVVEGDIKSDWPVPLTAEEKAASNALMETATEQNGTYFEYGQTVTSRWREYQALLGPTPVLGC